jgi:nucleotide-binding universal stress UspA family protein
MGRLALSARHGGSEDRGNSTRDTTMTAIEIRDPTTGPTGERPHRAHVRHVLLATDLGEASGRATEQAITLAARDNAVLQILAVARSHDDRDEMERRVQLVRRRARAAGVLATSIVWHGDPAEAIVEAAWTERPDVLVVGARHHRWLARLLGSVSDRVAEEAPCRVEIVPG